jgi:hypothetical protein
MKKISITDALVIHFCCSFLREKPIEELIYNTKKAMRSTLWGSISPED